MSQWYYIDASSNNQSTDEDTLAQMYRSGQINNDTYVWSEGTGPDWKPISALPQLIAKLKPAQTTSMPPRAGGGIGANIAAQAAQNKKLGPLDSNNMGAPVPVSTGTDNRALNIVKRQEPSHGWKELKSSDGQPYYYNVLSQQTQWEKPEVLKTADDYERDGTWYWAPHDEHGYIAARQVSNAGNKIVVEGEDGRQLTFTGKATAGLEPMKWLQLRHLQSDLVMLDVMNKPLILYNLKKRFENNEIYTSIGSILISFNPYKRLPLYTPTVMEEYIRRGNRKLPPHVFLIADDAFKSLLETMQSQSICISGESGAGKTECTKQALQYLAEIAGSAATNVEEKILASNPILEAFGNAKTVRNNNSSRFGKYVEIFFDGRAQICGSINTNYLLEKIRVVKQNKGERNYHAFYQIIRGGQPGELSKFKLEAVNKYWYLSQSGCDTVDDVDDQAEHLDVVKAMRELEWTPAEIDNVYQTVAAVLHLGNVSFRETGDRKCEVSNQTALQSTCSLLSIDTAGFTKAVTMRTMRIQGQADIDVPLGKAEAEAARDALAKFIYEKMFDWIVQRINKSIGRGSNAQPFTISILDIFGFEIFEHNQFEQLCINFTNEKLQQFFNQHTFKKEEELYKFEGISFAHVQYIDNQPILDLIENRPFGILPLVDEEIKMPKGSDKTFVQKLVQQHGKNSYFKSYLKNPEMFVVEHYAGTVVYDSNGFLEKNRDQLNEDAIAVINNSKFAFLRELFAEPPGQKKATLGTKFAGQLNQLMAALNQTEPHYIRCVKPNPNKAPMQFCGQMSLEQLQYAGVFEAVTIRKQGYPFRLTHAEFFRRYKCLFKDKHWDNRAIENCKFLISSMGLTTTEVQIGQTRVLYRAEQHRVMELKRNLAVEEVTIYTQKYCRRVLTRLLRERCIKYKPILKAAIDSRDLATVEAAISQASGLGFPIYELKQAQRFKYVIQEEKRLEVLFQVLVVQDSQEAFEEFQSAVASADDIELKSATANQVRQMYYEAKAVRDQITTDAIEQAKVLDEVTMKGVMQRADNIPGGYMCQHVEHLRTLLYNTSEDAFSKMQLKAAVQLKDPELIQARTIRVKDLFLDKSGHMFNFGKFSNLCPPIGWADKKTISFSREELADGMLKWTDSPIHAPLCEYDPTTQKELIATAKRMFKNVMGFMGDKKITAPIQLAVELVQEGLKTPQLRDELYCQIIKQLTNNPSPESQTKGWNLMIVCLHSFPPSETLENYLQMFFRMSGNPPRKFINLMHKTMYTGARTNYPTESDINTWIQQQSSLDCDDYKTKLAKAEARMRQSLEEEQSQQQQKRNGYGMGWGQKAAATGGGGGFGQSAGGFGSPGGGFGAAAVAPSSYNPGFSSNQRRASSGGPTAHVKPAPPSRPNFQYYVVVADSSQQGPVSCDDIVNMWRNGEINAQSYIWHEAMAGWLSIAECPDLFAWVKYHE